MNGEIKKADLFSILDKSNTKEDVNNELTKRNVKYYWAGRNHIGVLTEETSFEMYTFDREDTSLSNLIKEKNLDLSDDTFDFINEVDKRMVYGLSEAELDIVLELREKGATVDEVVYYLAYGVI